MSKRTIEASTSFVQAAMDIRTAIDKLQLIDGYEGFADSALAGLLLFYHEHEQLVKLQCEFENFKTLQSIGVDR